VDAPPPAPDLSLRHVALTVADLEAAERFYVEVLGMRVEWRPDPDNVYLTSGADNLALHRATGPIAGPGALDHLGFVVRRPEDVDAWNARLVAAGVPPAAGPKTHRDGARSLYVRDPAGNLVQIIYHPPISPRL
jgi:catechol 2,3-dioxygenase-like lactoylglutathione lyase family enzyme